MPLQRRIPKRGFNNIFAKTVAAVNLSTLNRKFEDGATVDIELLLMQALLRTALMLLKFLATVSLTKNLQ